LFAQPISGARQDAWVEVPSPNFEIVSNASENEARKFDVQFEPIREAFRKSLYVGTAHPTARVTCRGFELFRTLAVNSSTITLHAKNLRQIVFRANSARTTSALDLCTGLKDRLVEVGFAPD
jgi:hypothetical protein